jgi:hypothetical protein
MFSCRRTSIVTRVSSRRTGLEYIQGDSIVMKTKKQAAEIADYWERAGK